MPELKEKEEYSRTTLHVRKIPHGTDTKHLEAFFSEIGPIKYCFQVPAKNEQDQKSHQYGFVQYVTAEDAQRAIKELQQVPISGRDTLSLAFSKHRNRSGKNETLTAKDTERRVQREHQKKKVEFIKTCKISQRTVIVEGLDDQVVNKKLLYKKVKKFGTVAELQFPAPIVSYKVTTAESLTSLSTIEIKSRAQVIFNTQAEALQCIKHLHNHTYKGMEVKAYAAPILQDAKKIARLMVKNIPFSLEGDKQEEQVLYQAFSKHGCVMEVSVPREVRSTNGSGGKRNSGYAFVTMSTAKEAEKVIQAVSKQKIADFGNRRCTVNLVIPKSQYLQDQQDIKDGQSAKAQKTRQAKVSVVEQQVDDPESDQSGEESGSASEVEDLSDEDDDSVDIVMDDEVISVHEDQNAPKSITAFNEDCTLFVRNISFETTDQQLYDKFKEFGSLKYARIVSDRLTGRSRGTAFVQFHSPDGARKALDASSAISPALTDGGKILKIMPEMESGVHLDGRVLNVLPAVKKDKAEEISSQAFNAMYNPDDKDKRNIYLLKEGYIAPSSAAAKLLSDAQLQARQQSYLSRKAKLEKHMHMHLSKTRLSVRNLGKKPDETFLRALALNEVTAWRDELNAQLADGTIGKSEREELQRLKTKEGMDKSIQMRQVKIILDEKNLSKLDSSQLVKKGGKLFGQSLGYGFIEFARHAHALGCLRRLNNNPELVDGRRLIVEFAIENSVLLKQRDANRAASRANKTDGSANAAKRVERKQGAKGDKVRKRDAKVVEKDARRTKDAKKPKTADRQDKKSKDKKSKNKTKDAAKATDDVIDDKPVVSKKRKAVVDTEELATKFKRQLDAATAESTKRWFE